MPRNGSGTYTLPQSAFVPGTVISSAAVNSDFSDIATALTGSLPRDGQAGMTGQFLAVDGSNLAPGISFSNEQNTGFRRSTTGEITVDILGVSCATISSTLGWRPTGTIDATPVGIIDDYGGSTAPGGWLLCYGQAVSRTTYALLFAVIGTTYGSGDGTTTFNLPDGRGRIFAGKDNMGGVAANRITTAGSGIDGLTLGATGGAQNVTVAKVNIPAYALTVVDIGHNHNSIDGMTGVSHLNGSGAAFQSYDQVGSVKTFSTSTTGITVNSGGSGTALQTMPPTLVVNKIIYAGA